jgi:ribA/ribD-fused uncharacterized protein
MAAQKNIFNVLSVVEDITDKKRTSSQRSSNSDADGEESTQPQSKKQNIQLPNDDAPDREWYKFIGTQIMKNNKTIENLVKTCEFATKQAEKSMELANKLADKLLKVEKSLDNERTENQRLRREIINVNEKILRAECYQRRDNVIFDGIPEKKGETDYDCYCKIVNELSRVADIGDYAGEMRISRCHRLGPYTKGRSRGIICHIHWFGDRNLIMQHRLELQGSVTVRDDFPPEIEQRRKKLYPILKMARTMDKYRGKCKMAVDKLVIAGRSYTAGPQGNLNELPPDLNPIKVSEKTDEQTTLYFGVNHPFSNNYECQFSIDNTIYNSADQYIQSQKCKLFDDDIGHAKIMRARNAWEIRKLGSRARNFIPQRWATEAPRITYDALRAKFLQNSDPQRILLETGDTVIGEASRDSLWGIGCALHDRHVLQQHTWKGENVMGKALMKLRSELSKM